MKQIYSDLWQSEADTHFGMDLKSYLLKTPNGNILFYYSNAQQDQNDIKKLGGIDYQFMSHHHEFQKGLYENLEQFNPSLVLHENSLKYGNPDYSKHERITNSCCFLGVDIIYTPGHTDTNLCFYYPSPTGKNYLFVGDTFYLDRNRWNILIMKHEGGSKQLLKQSLLELKKLEIDVVFCSVSTGKNQHVEVDPQEWSRIIDDLVSSF